MDEWMSVVIVILKEKQMRLRSFISKAGIMVMATFTMMNWLNLYVINSSEGLRAR